MRRSNARSRVCHQGFLAHGVLLIGSSGWTPPGPNVTFGRTPSKQVPETATRCCIFWNNAAMEQNLPFDVDALLVFGKVVECRSLSKAATLLGMPKSTVSRKLSKLESDLGIKLLRNEHPSAHRHRPRREDLRPRREDPDRGQWRSRVGRGQQARTTGRAAGRHAGLRRHRLCVASRRHVPEALPATRGWTSDWSTTWSTRSGTASTWYSGPDRCRIRH